MTICVVFSLNRIVITFIHDVFIRSLISNAFIALLGFMPVLVLLVVINYTQIFIRFQKYIKYIILLQSIFAAIAITAPFHKLMAYDYRIEYIGFIPNLVYKMGIAFHIYNISISLQNLAALAMLLLSMIGKNKYYKRQIFFVFLGAAIPIFNEILFRCNISLVPNYQFTSVSLAFGCSLIAWSLFKYDFLKIIPLARSKMIEQIDDLMLVINQNDMLLDINKNCENFFNLSNKEVIGKPFHTIFANYSGLTEIYKNKTNAELLIQKNAKNYYFLVKSSTVKSDNAIPVANILLLHDISEIKESSLKLKESEEKYRNIFNNSIFGLFVIDKEGKYVTINPAFSKMTGYTAEDIVNKPIGSITHHDDLQAVQLSLQKIKVESMTTHNGEYRIVCKNGDIKWITVVACKYFNLQGEFEHILVECYDNTDKREAEDKLKKYAHELKEQNEAKNKFFSILAHDLRNPFNGLIGFSNLLLHNYQNYSKDELFNIFQIINDSSKTSYQLLENLLEWSCIQIGTINYSPTTFYLKKAIDESYEIEKENVKRKNMKLAIEIDSQIQIYADYNMIISILRNLLSNATKFTNANGEILITAQTNENNTEALISIKDKGIGISTEKQKKIFKIEHRISQPGTDNEKGSGLGLILCKEFVEKNKGQIWLKSQEQTGTTVSFTMPLNKNEQMAISTNNKETENESISYESENGNISDENNETSIKYQLPNNQYHKITEDLVRLLIVEKIYKNPNITLNTISEILRTNRVYVSQVINEIFNCNFNHLINKLRINEAIALLKTSQEQNINTESIIELSGFRNKSTFYLVFRKFTGKTPSEYLKEI